MPQALEFDGLTASHRETATWAASLVHALARDEVAGRRPERLTEPRLATWSRFRGRLTATDLIALLFEDAAVLHPVPFDAQAVGGAMALERLPEQLTAAWLEQIGSLELDAASADYITHQAKLLGLPTRLARSDLHVVKPHQKVLELPGTGGQLAHHLASSQTDVSLKDNFTVACGSWQELTLAGIVALDLGAPSTEFAARASAEDLRDPKHALRRRSFDFVIGLHPDKGGLFRVDDQLAIWFSGAKILLV
jgi:hypothetical protein